MKQTLFAILTDEKSREGAQVEANLSETFSAGKGWYGIKDK